MQGTNVARLFMWLMLPGNDDEHEVPSEDTAVATEADLKAIEEDWSWGCLVAGPDMADGADSNTSCLLACEPEQTWDTQTLYKGTPAYMHPKNFCAWCGVCGAQPLICRLQLGLGILIQSVLANENAIMPQLCPDYPELPNICTRYAWHQLTNLELFRFLPFPFIGGGVQLGLWMV